MSYDDPNCIHCIVGRWLAERPGFASLETVNHLCQSIGEIIAALPPEHRTEARRDAFAHLGRHVTASPVPGTLRANITGALSGASELLAMAAIDNEVPEAEFKQTFARELVRLASHLSLDDGPEAFADLAAGLFKSSEEFIAAAKAPRRAH